MYFPFNLLFMIPLRCTDIKRAVQEMVDEHYSCRFCLLACNVDPSRGPHNSLECPSLPTEPLELYISIANRRANVRRFEKLAFAGHHSPIVTTRGPLGLQPDNSRVTISSVPPPPQQPQSILRHPKDSAQG